jgi:hypothetical protein
VYPRSCHITTHQNCRSNSHARKCTLPPARWQRQRRMHAHTHTRVMCAAYSDQAHEVCTAVYVSESPASFFCNVFAPLELYCMKFTYYSKLVLSTSPSAHRLDGPIDVLRASDSDTATAPGSPIRFSPRLYGICIVLALQCACQCNSDIAPSTYASHVQRGAAVPRSDTYLSNIE